MQIYTDFGHLMRLAKALGDAKKTKNTELITKAQLEHDSYKKLCLQSDFMHIGCTIKTIT